jgi:hypothetical protein
VAPLEASHVANQHQRLHLELHGSFALGELEGLLKEGRRAVVGCPRLLQVRDRLANGEPVKEVAVTSVSAQELQSKRWR